MPPKRYPTTPDGRYFVVRGRLWRCSNPNLDEATRARLVRDLMHARRAMGQSRKDGDRAAGQEAKRQVNEAKIALGERGPVWWDDGEPDYNRHMALNTPYREWFEGLGEC